jgi:uncharacterized protein YjbI with pentapeptide repeats
VPLVGLKWIGWLLIASGAVVLVLSLIRFKRSKNEDSHSWNQFLSTFAAGLAVALLSLGITSMVEYLRHQNNDAAAQSALEAIDSGRSMNGLSFSVANDPHAYLADRDLEGLTIQHANLPQSNISGSSAEYAHLSGALLNGMDAADANLSYADLERSDIPNGNLSSTTDIFTDFSFGEYRKIDANQACFRGADFDHADLEDANFSHTSLEDASFVGANLNGSNFDNANLSGADLLSARTSGATFVNVTYSATTQWPAGSREPSGLNESTSSIACGSP